MACLALNSYWALRDLRRDSAEILLRLRQLRLKHEEVRGDAQEQHVLEHAPSEIGLATDSLERRFLRHDRASKHGWQALG
jgi:hypothetical protein